MDSGCLILSERTGSWARLFRKALADVAGETRGVMIRETRSIAECRESLNQWPASVVGIELASSNLDAAMEFMAEVATRFRAARILALASHEQRAYEGLARELGAVGFIASPQAVRLEAEWISRRLAGTSRPETNITDRIRAELPWGLGA